MFRGGIHDEQSLIACSMLDHDIFVDNYDFDQYPSPSLDLFEDVDFDAVNASSSTNSSLSGGRKNHVQRPFAIPSQLAQQQLLVPAREPATPATEEQKSGVFNLVPYWAPTSPEAGVSWSTGFGTGAWKSRFVPDKTQVTGTCGRSSSEKANACESSSDDCSENIYRNISTGARVTVDEVTEDELNNLVDIAQRSRWMCDEGSQQPSLENASQPVFQAHDIHGGGGESHEEMQTVVKNGFEELLLMARKQESSQLALWKSCEENATFPKMICQQIPGTLLATVHTVESIYGVAYCACELSNACNITSKICLMLPLELAEREKLGCGVILRIFPPWRTHTLYGSEKVLSAVQYFEVLDRLRQRL